MWGWLAAGLAATLIFFGLLLMLSGLDVLELDKSGFFAVFIGGLLIIWATCIAAPLLLKAIKAAKGDK